MVITKGRPVIYYILSFTIPTMIILVALAGLGITPFGNKTLVISDGDGLYINHLGYVGRVVQGQEGVFFSFEKGLGANMMDSWGWFLLNPFFTLFAFFDITNYTLAFTLVSLLNFSFCGLTMYIFLKDVYGHRASNLIFSSSYALNGFLVANVFQMNFFTGVWMLPLVVLGLRKILKNGNPLLYILSLAYTLFANFYFGFILCIASILIFVVSLFVDGRQIVNRKNVVFKYIISSSLAGVMASIVWLPALLALRGGRLDQSIISVISFKENMPFLEIAAKLFSGANSTAQLSNGLPNIFVGILPIALTILFFMNKKIDQKSKIKGGILLGGYLLSFYIVAINILMHGGTVTNWFNYRYSFVFCFLLLMIAAHEWKYVTDEPMENVKKTAIIMIIAAIAIFSKQYEFVSGGEVVLDFTVLGIIFLACRMHINNPEKNSRRTFELIVLILVSINLFLNYRFSVKNIEEWGITVHEYQEIVAPVSAMVDAVKNSDPAFYRMEIGEQRSGTLGNDPMLYGYDGVGHGGSDDKNSTRTTLSQLGIHRYDMRNYYGKGIPAATDTLLGIKYVISKGNLTEEKGYERRLDLAGWGLYENDFALPVSFVTESTIEEVNIDFTDIFDNLNHVWSALAGKEEKVFIEESDITFVSHNLFDPMEMGQDEAETIVSKRDAEAEKVLEDAGNRKTGSGTEEDPLISQENTKNSKLQEGILKAAPENSAYIEYYWTATRDGAIYSYNRSGMGDENGALISALNYEGYYHKGDVVKGYLPVGGGFVSKYLLEEVAGRFKAAYVDTEALADLSGEILLRPSSIEKIKDSYLKGSFTLDSNQILLFTVPYDEGWTCFIDGKEVPVEKALNIFMVVRAEKGEHTFEMKFMPAGLKIGAGACIAAIVMTVIFIMIDRRKVKKKNTVTESE